LLGLIPLFLAGFKPIALLSGLAILILYVRKRVTTLDPDSKEIKYHIEVFGIAVPFTTEVIRLDTIDKLSVKFLIENTLVTASRSNVPTRFDIKEYSLVLSFLGSKKPLKMKVFNSYEEALKLGEKISKDWNLRLVDYIKIRDQKAKKRRIERQKRGLR
tara:strand:- start:6666 stop:7142 length:477 start_codon:yes stop_codon:yes gene_type:complete